MMHLLIILPVNTNGSRIFWKSGGFLSIDMPSIESIVNSFYINLLLFSFTEGFLFSFFQKMTALSHNPSQKQTKHYWFAHLVGKWESLAHQHALHCADCKLFSQHPSSRLSFTGGFLLFCKKMMHFLIILPHLKQWCASCGKVDSLPIDVPPIVNSFHSIHLLFYLSREDFSFVKR